MHAVRAALTEAAHRVHIFTRDETGLVHLPTRWSVHCNFTGDGKCNERGWACTTHPYQPGLILPSWWKVRQKAAVATLCTLCAVLLYSLCTQPWFATQITQGEPGQYPPDVSLVYYFKYNGLTTRLALTFLPWKILRFILKKLLSNFLKLYVQFISLAEGYCDFI